MATAATRTPTDARTRSLELAAALGQTTCSHAARTVGWTLDANGALASLALHIASAHSDAAYCLTYTAASDDAHCDCAAGAHQRACWHRGLALLCGRAVARLYSPAGRAESERTYRADLASEGNTAALAPSL
jgi:hypothetical protein